MSLKRKLKDLSIATLATVILASGCASTNYQSRYSGYENNNSRYKNLENQDGERTGFEIIPEKVKFFGDAFRIEGISSDGREISVYEDIDESNYNLLVNVAADLTKIIELNDKSPDGHPLRGIYVTGKYDHKLDANDILELETLNVNGELYYTDPANKSGLNIDINFEFWGQSWWRGYNQAHYPVGLRPWWDPNRTGIISGYHFGLSNPDEDWDGDGISNWAERNIGTNPYSRDSDYDGLDDLTELWFGTNPRDRDSDNDGYWDGEDPFPLWHSRHHRNHQHNHWHLWWNHHYDNMQRRQQPISKPEIPGERWRTKPERSSERVRYKQRLNTHEEVVRRNVEGSNYVPRVQREPREDSRRIISPRQKEIRRVPNRKKEILERRVQPRTREVKQTDQGTRTKVKERKEKKSKKDSSRSKTNSNGRRTR